MDKSKKPDIRVRRVAESLHADLMNIAANKGITLNNFLRYTLRDIANSFPPEMKKPLRD